MGISPLGLPNRTINQGGQVMRIITIGATILALIIVVSASAREIFVDNVAGNDLFSGKQPYNTPEQTGPVRTLAKALGLALYGDTIVLANRGMPYRESVSLVGGRHSGSLRQPFTIRGNGAILDGSRPIDPNAWKPYQGNVFWYRPNRMSYQQLYIDGRPAAQVVVPGWEKRFPQLKKLEWCSFEGAIFFCVEDSKLPGDYNLSCTDAQTGITLYQVDNVLIDDLIVQGFQLDGISLPNSARNVMLSNVTCRGNGRSGVAVGGASTVDIENSALGNNGVAQLLTLPYSTTRLSDSLLLGNTAPGWVELGGRVSIDDNQIEGGLEWFPAKAEQEQTP